MLLDTKISGTITEFGKGVINALPYAHSRQDMENAMRLIITVWNSIVLDTWHKTDANEKRLLDTITSEPKPVQLEIKRLIKRKKKKFANDIRAVGNHWIREEQGEFIFGCEARLNVENIPGDENIPKH